MTQVVIVGAGPTGTSLALLLVKRGITVTLIEAAQDFHRVFRGEGLMPSGLEALEQMGLSDILQQIPHRAIDAWEFILDDRLLFRVEEPMGANYPCTFISHPPLLEALIAEAKLYSDFTFISGVPVKNLIWEGDRAIGVQLGDGQRMLAPLVIGADGRNSVIRQQAGLTLIKQPNNINVLWFKLLAHPRFVAENCFCSILKHNQGFSLFHGAEPGKLHLAWILANDHPIESLPTDWAETFAALSPSWLADHFRAYADTIEHPIRLSVVVGLCPCWFKPGVLLLGDAAHPMSPIRAQGINLALRDVIVAANHLVPLLKSGADSQTIDLALSRIQAEREPEIIRAQALQKAEADQGEKLRNHPLQRALISQLAPLFRQQIRRSWVQRQSEMRQGVTQVKLMV